jgi:hypothetical protein
LSRSQAPNRRNSGINNHNPVCVLLILLASISRTLRSLLCTVTATSCFSLFVRWTTTYWTSFSGFNR